jgi:hypothetical protein
MQKLTKEQEIEQVKSNLSKCRTLVDVIDQDWINNQILQKMERAKAHTLFWLLLNKNRSQKLDSWLAVLKATLPPTKFQGLINKMKRKTRKIEFYSLLSEIEVVSYYAKREHIMEYEPPHGDLKLILNGSEVFFEIARLFSSQEEERISSLVNLVWSKLDNLNSNKYVISFRISPEFSESDVNSFMKFVSNIVTQEFEKFPSEKCIYAGGKASVTILFISPRERGYVGGSLIGATRINSARRLKDKILDEISQLPKNQLNTVVYNITHLATEFDDIEDAFYGQSALRIYKETMKTEPIRKSNGVIHKKEGEQISAIIAYEDFNYENRRIYPNPKAKIPITQEIVEKI